MLFQCQISSPLAVLESIQYEVGQFEASLEAPSRQLSAFYVEFIVGESKRDQSRALVDTEVEKCQDLEEILTELQRHLDNHLSLLC